MAGALLMAAAALHARGQEAAAAAGNVSGQVVNAITGEPVPKAQVTFDGSGRGFSSSRGPSRGPVQAPNTRQLATGDDGSFTAAGLAPGRYRVWASRNGYVRSEYGARAPMRGGTPVELAPGGEVKDVVIRLTPHSVIAGRVFNEDREPAPYVQVQAVRAAYRAGRRELTPIGSGATNDLGEYRIFGLPPGRYYLNATPRETGDTGVADLPTWFPGTADLSGAMLVETAAGSVRQGVDLVLVRSATVRVRGRVLNAAPGAQRNVAVHLIPKGPAVPIGAGRHSAIVRDAEGRFEVRGVPPGDYVAVAEQYEERRMRTARLDLAVGPSGVDNLELALEPPMEISGRLVVKGHTQVALDKLWVHLEPSSGLARFGSGGGGRVQQDGSFVIQNVRRELYMVRVAGAIPANVYLAGARAGQQEVIETGLDLSHGVAGALEVTLSDAGSQLTGVVEDKDGKPAVRATVALIPQPSRRRHPDAYKAGVTGADGRFTIEGIRPGAYMVYAFEDVESEAWKDQEFMQPYESFGKSLSLSEGAVETLQLKAIPAAN